MNPFQNDLWEVLTTLNKQQVKFVLCGKAAMLVRGMNTSIFNIEICMDPGVENAQNLAEAARILKLKGRAGYSPEDLPGLINGKIWNIENGAMIFTLENENSANLLYVYITYPIPFYDLYLRANIIHFNGFNFAVASLEDLLYAKSLMLPRDPEDEDDIEALKKILNQ